VPGSSEFFFCVIEALDSINNVRLINMGLVVLIVLIGIAYAVYSYFFGSIPEVRPPQRNVPQVEEFVPLLRSAGSAVKSKLGPSKPIRYVRTGREVSIRLLTPAGIKDALVDVNNINQTITVCWQQTVDESESATTLLSRVHGHVFSAEPTQYSNTGQILFDKIVTVNASDILSIKSGNASPNFEALTVAINATSQTHFNKASTVQTVGTHSKIPVDSKWCFSLILQSFTIDIIIENAGTRERLFRGITNLVEKSKTNKSSHKKSGPVDGSSKDILDMI
jgi:hypothetical protein